MPLLTNGAGLRERRELKGMTLAEFARKAGYSVNHVSQVELGRSNGGLRFLRTAADIFDCGIEDLTKGSVPRRKSPGSAAA
ncbi:helix-turn-helix domain-containing protein [Streptomyces sp. NPDC050535]|uniref:helix-turn-helix domain-containing protein n=1 Tax=Streptomyces sp. NPDC050535 TaxID=3365626 RepID=UPI0037B8B895